MANKYLDYNGLDYFWDKIDNKKQNKLTAGSNITISGSTISASQPTVNNGTLTIQKNGSNVQTFTANQSTNVTANIVVPTKTSDITNDSGFITSSGTVAKANQLTTARTIGIGTGGTGTATSFNGTANITIPLTDVKDSYVTWGGKSLAANVTPDDMGCIDEFGHNKLAFLPAECITVEYTTDGGTTWTDYGATDAQKVRMVSTTGTSFMAGGPSAVPTADNIADFKVRVRVASMTPSGTSKLYSAMVKCLLNITTNGASGTKVAIRSRTVANYKARVDTWVNRGEFDIGGWSGWNSIPFNYTFGGTSDSQLAQFEFVFWGTGKHANYNSKVAVIDIRMIGKTNWTTPSEMARAGHLYTVDESQDAIFPAKVIAPKIETGTGANNYFQSQKFRGQGDASSYYHAIDFGYGGHDQVDFYEYGGVWNFWKNTSTTATTDVNNLALGITLNALKNKSYTYTFPNKTGTFALTSDIPSVPTVNNGTLTIQKNGSNVATFTANQSGNATANITVPTKTSDITNDSGFLTSIPKASASTLGGIKVGNNLTISSDGTLSANASSITVDSALSSTSTNPVQNKVINTALNGKQHTLTAGSHIDITNNVIKAKDYVHSEQPVATQAVTPVVTGSMISNGTITADKLASGVTVQLTLSNVDIGEGSALAANTLYGVYE